jgi:hypothetical protein
MKRFVGPVSLIAVLAAAALYVGSAVGSSTNFKATYKGKVTEVVNGSTVNATPNGKGTATLIGKGSITGKVVGNTSNPPCTPITGTGVLKGAKGSLKLSLTNKPAPSRACAAGQDDQNNITYSGSAKVTGGTGVLKKASGTLHYYGHYDRGTGAFNFTLTGTLKH